MCTSQSAASLLSEKAGIAHSTGGQKLGGRNHCPLPERLIERSIIHAYMTIQIYRLCCCRIYFFVVFIFNKNELYIRSKEMRHCVKSLSDDTNLNK